MVERDIGSIIIGGICTLVILALLGFMGYILYLYITIRDRVNKLLKSDTSKTQSTPITSTSTSTSTTLSTSTTSTSNSTADSSSTTLKYSIPNVFSAVKVPNYP